MQSSRSLANPRCSQNWFFNNCLKPVFQLMVRFGTNLATMRGVGNRIKVFGNDNRTKQYGNKNNGIVTLDRNAIGHAGNRNKSVTKGNDNSVEITGAGNTCDWVDRRYDKTAIQLAGNDLSWKKGAADKILKINPFNFLFTAKK